jgi:predicted RNA binding protein YcfA (HicA-like mRNA interferase family)
MPLSGKEIVKILQKHGFIVSRQKGSHIVLYKQTSDGKKIGVVPNHREVQKGTIRSIAKMTGLDPKELGL